MTTSIIVETGTQSILVNGGTQPCRIGRSGICAVDDKTEGDGRTPVGRWPLRAALLRPDAGFSPPQKLPWRWIRPQDGWSDDGADPAYNRPVTHPHHFSAERLWREDGVYDAIIVLGHNDAPPIPRLGSAIFLHLIGEGDTQGCVAVSPETMREFLATLSQADRLEIR